MPMQSEKLANGPLTGYELALRIEHALARQLRERIPDREPTDAAWRQSVLDTLHDRVLHDWVFGVTILWPLVSYLLEFKCWFTAPGVTVQIMPGAARPTAFWDLRIVINTQNIHLKEHKVALGIVTPVFPQVEAGVVAFAFTEKIENPNLVRVHTGIPIEVTEVVRPGPGQTIGSLVKHEVKYDVRDYEPLPGPAVEDTSAAVRVEWGMPQYHFSEIGTWPGGEVEEVVPSPLVAFTAQQFHQYKEEAAPDPPTSLTPAVRKAIDLVNRKRKERGKPEGYKPTEDPEDLDAVSSEEPER